MTEKISSLKLGKSTAMISFESKVKIEQIYDIFKIGNSQLYDVQILSKFYKDSEQNIHISGIKDESYKYGQILQNIMTITCQSNIVKSQEFKIRWFFTGTKHRVHIISYLKQNISGNILSRFINCMKKKVKFYDIQPITYLSVDGSTNMEKPIIFNEVADKLDKMHGLSYVYTPSLVPDMKIYFQEGTVSLEDNGKIFYMGSQNEETLIKLHGRIEKIASSICSNSV